MCFGDKLAQVCALVNAQPINRSQLSAALTDLQCLHVHEVAAASSEGSSGFTTEVMKAMNGQLKDAFRS